VCHYFSLPSPISGVHVCNTNILYFRRFCNTANVKYGKIKFTILLGHPGFFALNTPLIFFRINRVQVHHGKGTPGTQEK
jgi:hypothetical protein